MAIIKNPSKASTKTTAKARSVKKNSIVSSSVASFVNQATYEQRVQVKAYELYLQRGAAHGNALADWFQAEKIVATQSK